MKRRILIACGTALLLSAAGGAQALPGPAPGVSGGLVQQAAEGCGRGFFRNARGVCRPMRGMRRCVVRRTPWGPRRICR